MSPMLSQVKQTRSNLGKHQTHSWYSTRNPMLVTCWSKVTAIPQPMGWKASICLIKNWMDMSAGPQSPAKGVDDAGDNNGTGNEDDDGEYNVYMS